MKIQIDWDLCQGHGVCEGEAPEVFRVNDAGELEVLQHEPPEALRPQVEVAATYCPTQAISLVEAAVED